MHFKLLYYRYPPDKYPVYALRGAPAAFPVQPQYRELQRYMEFSEGISKVGDNYINETFRGEKYIGIHLRNGDDWVKLVPCSNIEVTIH